MFTYSMSPTQLYPVRGCVCLYTLYLQMFACRRFLFSCCTPEIRHRLLGQQFSAHQQDWPVSKGNPQLYHLEIWNLCPLLHTDQLWQDLCLKSLVNVKQKPKWRLLCVSPILCSAYEVLAAAAEVLRVSGGRQSPGGSAGAPWRADPTQVQHGPHPRS